MSSTTLNQLINLLTRPLVFTHPAITIAQLQLALQTNLSTIFSNQSFAPFTLHLSAHALPIPPIYAACLTLGLCWESWVAALSGGKDLYVFIMEGCIRVGVPNTQETVVVWKESSETKPSTASKLQAMLDSARARKQAQATTEKPILTLPALRITPSTPSVPSHLEPSSPVSATSSISSSSSDTDSDSDSDTESTTSSTFSSRSSQSSQSSVSSSSSSTKACSNAFGTPFFRTIPRAPRRREHVTQSQTQSPTLRVAKATITKYTYQGGQTGVMTGGVMLGGSGSGRGVAAVAAVATTTSSGKGSSKGAEGSANWRRSSTLTSRRV